MATITAVGIASVSVPPDEAALTLGVEATRATPQEALDDVAARATTLVTLCDELSIEPARRTTSGVSVAEVGEHDREGRYQHRGYTATESLSVRVEAAETIGRLLREAVDRAAASVQGPWWTVSAANPARLEAAAGAAAAARQRAEALAAGLGVRLGALVEAVEGGAQPPQPRPSYRMLAAEAVPVEAGELSVVSSVTVTYQVEQP